MFDRRSARRKPSIPLRVERCFVRSCVVCLSFLKQIQLRREENGTNVANVYCGHEHVALAAADKGQGAFHLR